MCIILEMSKTEDICLCLFISEHINGLKARFHCVYIQELFSYNRIFVCGRGHGYCNLSMQLINVYSQILAVTQFIITTN